MSEPFIGQLTQFGGNFAPVGWAFCSGQLLSIAENDALFSLIGTTYGGDGQTTFALPDLRGRVALHQGSGPGLSARTIGEMGGSETVSLTTPQLPNHGHGLRASTDVATSASPSGTVPAQSTTVDLYIEDTPTVALAAGASSAAGANASHDNMMPYQTVSWIISLYGIYPSRT